MYWTARSTLPMSMPNSSVLVQMMALSLPALKLSSMFTRSSLLSDPWCTAMSARFSWLNRCPSISAMGAAVDEDECGFV